LLINNDSFWVMVGVESAVDIGDAVVPAVLAVKAPLIRAACGLVVLVEWSKDCMMIDRMSSQSS
jgi:hypothetical protein